MFEVKDKLSEIVILFPDSWDEVTLKQFNQLRSLPEEATTIDVLIILADAPEHLTGLNDPLADAEIMKGLGFLASIPDFLALPAPEVVILRGAKVRVPENIGLETYGQKLAVDELLKEITDTGASINPYTAAIPLISVYLSERPFVDLEQARALMQEVEKMKATEALALSAFFLTNWQNLTSSGALSLRTLKRPTKPKTWLKFWFLNWPIFRRMPKRRQ